MELDGVEPRATAERADFLTEDDVDAAPSIERDQMLRDLGRTQLAEQVDVATDERDQRCARAGECALRDQSGRDVAVVRRVDVGLTRLDAS